MAFPFGDFEAGVYSVGAEGEHETRALVRNLKPETGQSRLDVDLSLDSSPARQSESFVRSRRGNLTEHVLI